MRTASSWLSWNWHNCPTAERRTNCHEALGWEIRNAYKSNVFADGKFSPNMRCYRMTLRAMGYDVTPEELEHLWQTAVDSADPV